MGVEAEVELLAAQRSADLAAVIAGVAEGTEASMIVVGSRGRGSAAGTVLGSVSHNLRREFPTPAGAPEGVSAWLAIGRFDSNTNRTARHTHLIEILPWSRYRWGISLRQDSAWLRSLQKSQGHSRIALASPGSPVHPDGNLPAGHGQRTASFDAACDEER